MGAGRGAGTGAVMGPGRGPKGRGCPGVGDTDVSGAG